MAVKKVLATETLQENITFEFGDVVYVVPPAKEWDIDVIEAQENGKMVTALKIILGDKQYATFRSKHKKMSQLEEFVERMYDAVDTDPKDSPTS